jgi:hypothetical protein
VEQPAAKHSGKCGELRAPPRPVDVSTAVGSRRPRAGTGDAEDDASAASAAGNTALESSGHASADAVAVAGEAACGGRPRAQTRRAQHAEVQTMRLLIALQHQHVGAAAHGIRLHPGADLELLQAVVAIVPCGRELAC